MSKTKELLEIPPVLTPELIKAIAENADALQAVKSILSSDDEAMALKDGGGCKRDDECCCPKFLKFKIVASTVIIINDNAECEDERPC